MDAFGAVALTGFALLLAFNQVVIKVSNDGFEPIFQAGLRSFGAMIVMILWMSWRGIPLTLPRVTIFGGVLSGVLFAIEFMALYKALDLTTVSRASVIFYSMPMWLALFAHILLPGEKLSGVRLVGLVLSMVGVAIAVMDRGEGSASLLGDLLALVATLCWTGIALCVRLTRLSEVPPEKQVFWQLIVSAPILLVTSVFVGEFVRDVQPYHIAGLGFQIVAVASLGFMFWFWLLTIYPASSVASFSFLSPVFSVLLGWLLLKEQVGLGIWLALVLVAAGIFLINRRV